MGPGKQKTFCNCGTSGKNRLLTIFAVGASNKSEVHDERRHDVVRLVELEPAQLRGRGARHRGQGVQGDGHGEAAQRSRIQLEGHEVRL